MKEENNFLKGAFILSIAAVLVKILGAIYRIPLSNLIKSEGMGYYQTAYPFYTLLLTISTAGFPVAIAKLVSEKRSIEDYRGAHRVFKISLIFLFVFGLISSVYLYLNAHNIVNNIGNTKAYYSLVGLAPALVFVPVMSVLRGYFQGSQDMVPTAISQTLEQFFRVFLGLSLTILVLDKGIPMAAGAASFGATIGAVAGTLAVIVIYFKRKPKIDEEIKRSVVVDEEPSAEILKSLLKIAVPITLGAAILPIMDYIDLKIVLKKLQTINFTEAEANALYGNFKGMAQTLINLPQVFAVALSVSLVPAISNTKARDDLKGTEKIISSGIKTTLMLGLPCAIGLFLLARPIIGLLYYKNTVETIVSTGNILKVLSLGVIFLTLVQTLAAMLQGLGHPLIPAANLLVGALVKAVLTYTLTGVEYINIYGAAFSTVVAFAIAALLDIIAIKKVTGYKIDYDYILKKPLISAIGMGIVVKISFVLIKMLVGQSIATLGSIMLGGITYVILLFVTGAISEEELKIMPKGDKINGILRKFRKQ